MALACSWWFCSLGSRNFEACMRHACIERRVCPEQQHPKDMGEKEWEKERERWGRRRKGDETKEEYKEQTERNEEKEREGKRTRVGSWWRRFSRLREVWRFYGSGSQLVFFHLSSLSFYLIFSLSLLKFESQLCCSWARSLSHLYTITCLSSLSLAGLVGPREQIYGHI